MFEGFNEDSSNNKKLNMVETDLFENQKEHSHFRACHVDLEESITDVSHELDYTKENLNLKIEKNLST